MTRVVLIPSQELPQGLPYGFRGPRTWTILYSLPRPHQRAELEAEQLDLELAPTWDADTTGSSFNYHTTAQAPEF